MAGRPAFVDLAVASHVPPQRPRRVQAHQGRGRLRRGRRERPRCSSASTAPRGIEARSRSTSTLGRPEARSTASSWPSSTCSSFPERDLLRSRRLPSEGRGDRRVIEDYSRRLTEERARVRQLAGRITRRTFSRSPGILDWFADGMYPPMELDGGTDYYLKKPMTARSTS